MAIKSDRKHDDISVLIALRAELDAINHEFGHACVNNDAQALRQAFAELEDYWIRCIRASQKRLIDISTNEVRKTVTDHRASLLGMLASKALTEKDLTSMVGLFDYYSIQTLLEGEGRPKVKLKLAERAALYKDRLHEFIAIGGEYHHSIHLPLLSGDGSMQLAQIALEFFAHIPDGHRHLSRIGFFKSFLRVLPSKKSCTYTTLPPKLVATIRANQTLVLDAAYYDCGLNPDGTDIPKSIASTRPAYEHFSVWFLSELHRNGLTDLAHDLMAVDYSIDDDQDSPIKIDEGSPDYSFRLLSLMEQLGLEQTAKKTWHSRLNGTGNRSWVSVDKKHDLLSCLPYFVEIAHESHDQAIAAIDRFMKHFDEFADEYTERMARMLAEQLAVIKHGALHDRHQERLDHLLDACSVVFAHSQYAQSHLEQFNQLPAIIQRCNGFRRATITQGMDL